MKRNLTLWVSVLLFAAFVVTKAYTSGTTYYIDPVGGLDANDGLTTGTPKQTFAILCDNTGHKNFYLLADQTIYTGTTSCNVRVTGTSSTDPVIIGRYGSGADPMIDGSSSLSSWTTVDAQIYSKASAVSFVSNVLTEDGVRLAERKWNTNIATTKAGTTSNCTAGQPPSTTSDDCNTDAMVAGTWTQDTSTFTIYVYPSSGTPASHTYRYATTRDPFFGKSTAQKILFQNIQGRYFARNMIGFGIEGDFHSDVTVDGLSIYMTGSRAVSIIGHRARIINTYAEDWASEALTDNAGALVIAGNGSNAPSVGGEMYNNRTRRGRNGSCAEINGTIGVWVHQNDFQGCAQLGIEQYGSSGGAIISSNNLVERNFISTIGAISLDPFSNCLRAGNYTHGNINQNNICFGYWNQGLNNGIGIGTKFLFNTFITLKNNSASASSGEGGFVESSTSSVAPWVIGNIFYIPNGGRCINVTAAGSTAVIDQNPCYQVGHANPYRFRNVAYSTLAAYQSAYTTATGLTDSSIYGTIDIDLGTYELNAGSNLIGIGRVLGVMTDYDGNKRGFYPDLGAKQRGTPATVSRINGNLKINGAGSF